jgi:hypothetical protein
MEGNCQHFIAKKKKKKKKNSSAAKFDNSFGKR